MYRNTPNFLNLNWNIFSLLLEKFVRRIGEVGGGAGPACVVHPAAGGSVPGIVAGGPGQAGGEGREEVEEWPGDEDIVVNTDVERQHQHPISNTYIWQSTFKNLYFIFISPWKRGQMFQIFIGPSEENCPAPISQRNTGIPIRTSDKMYGTRNAPGIWKWIQWGKI